MLRKKPLDFPKTRSELEQVKNVLNLFCSHALAVTDHSGIELW